MKIWILTEEYNQYDQYGEYYVAAWSQKPTAAQLAVHVDYTDEGITHILGGGGRLRYEDRWYWLREEDID